MSGGYQKVASNIKYWKLDEVDPGELLVDGGIYIGTQEGKLGPEYRFKEPKRFVMLSGRHLGWLLDNNVDPGMRVRVYYEGKEVLLTGKFKGSKAHRFELEVHEDDIVNFAPSQKSPKTKQDSKRAERAEHDDYEPRKAKQSRLDDEYEDAPRKRRSYEDEDDEPVIRRRESQVEREERPARKTREPDFAVEEERPARRSRPEPEPAPVQERQTRRVVRESRQEALEAEVAEVAEVAEAPKLGRGRPRKPPITDYSHLNFDDLNI